MVLELRRFYCRTPEELLSGVPLRRRYNETALVEFRVQRALLRQEFSNRRDEHFPRENWFVPTWSAVIRLLSGKSCSREKSRAKVHLDGRHF
jgi:hypothetical protein